MIAMRTETTSRNRARGDSAREGGLSARGGRARVDGSPLFPLSQLASLSTTPEIFARGLALWRGGWVRDTLYSYVFHVVGESALYSVNLKTLTCDCEWWRGKGKSAGMACKHIVGAGARAVEVQGG